MHCHWLSLVFSVTDTAKLMKIRNEESRLPILFWGNSNYKCACLKSGTVILSLTCRHHGPQYCINAQFDKISPVKYLSHDKKSQSLCWLASLGQGQFYTLQQLVSEGWDSLLMQMGWRHGHIVFGLDYILVVRFHSSIFWGLHPKLPACFCFTPLSLPGTQNLCVRYMGHQKFK